jgi:magnesium transporter
VIRSFVLQNGRVVAENLDLDALRLARGDAGLHVWVDLHEPTPEEVRQVLEGVFNFHPLAIEDCLNASELPKIEDFDTYVYMVVHAIDFTAEETFQTTELDVFLGKEFLVTYHTKPLRAVNTAVDRLKNGTGQPPRGPDRLLHWILDSLVDYYKAPLDQLGMEVAHIEDVVIEEDRNDVMKSVLRVKRQLGALRSTIRPQQEVLMRLARGEFKLIRAHLLPYYRDIADNLARFEIRAAHYSEELLTVTDVYLNKAQNETNHVIKALTIMTAITLPVTIVSGWYGMNFDSMHEVKQPHGYHMAWIITLVSTGAIVVWARRKGWF